MTADILVQEEIKKFPTTDEAIAELRDQYMPLKVNGIDDKDGYQVVQSALREVKSKRIAVEKKRKELNEIPLKWQRTVNDEAKRITGLILPIEDHLSEQKSLIDAEKQRLKEEREQKKQKRVNDRIQSLFNLGFSFNGNDYVLGSLSISPSDIEKFSDSDFSEMLQKGEQQAILKKQQEEEAERKRAEEEKLLKQQREAQDRKEAELRKREQELAEQQQKIDRERQEKELKIREEKAKKEREEKILRLKPERDQLELWINSIELPSKPELTSPSSAQFMDQANSLMKEYKSELKKTLNQLYYDPNK